MGDHLWVMSVYVKICLFIDLCPPLKLDRPAPPLPLALRESKQKLLDFFFFLSNANQENQFPLLTFIANVSE